LGVPAGLVRGSSPVSFIVTATWNLRGTPAAAERRILSTARAILPSSCVRSAITTRTSPPPAPSRETNCRNCRRNRRS